MSEYIRTSITTKLKFSNKIQENKIKKVIEAERTAFNFASQIFYNFKNSTKNSNNCIKILHSLVYSRFRKENPNIPSAIVIRAEQSCLAAYRSIKANKYKISKAAEKKNLSLQLDKQLYSYRDTHLKIITLEKSKRIWGRLVLYPRLSEYLSKYEFGDPLIYIKNDEVYISLPFKIPKQKSELKKLLLVLIWEFVGFLLLPKVKFILIKNTIKENESLDILKENFKVKKRNLQIDTCLKSDIKNTIIQKNYVNNYLIRLSLKQKLT